MPVCSRCGVDITLVEPEDILPGLGRQSYWVHVIPNGSRRWTCALSGAVDSQGRPYEGFATLARRSAVVTLYEEDVIELIKLLENSTYPTIYEMLETLKAIKFEGELPTVEKKRRIRESSSVQEL